MKPGVMIYFGDAKVLEKMTDEEAGMLFRGIIGYAEHGVLPPFADGNDKLGLLWVHFQQSVDADSERYAKVKKQKRYARYCGTQRANGKNPIPYADWIKLTDVDGCQRVLTDVTITNTNTSTITNTNSSTSTSSNTSTNFKLSSNRKKDKKESPADILKAEYEAAFGGGPSDLSEWMYLCDNYSPDAIRKVMREAKERGMKREAAWAYVSTRVAFED